MTVPGHQYGINIVRTIEPPFGKRLPALILDIDVFHSGGLATNDSSLETSLSEMRWLKNKAFFGSLLPSVIDSFR